MHSGFARNNGNLSIWEEGEGGDETANWTGVNEFVNRRLKGKDGLRMQSGVNR